MAAQRAHSGSSPARAFRAARTAREAATGAVGIVPSTLLAAAALFAGIHALGFAPRLLSAAPTLLPIDPDLSQRLTAAVTAVALTGVAAGLARHKHVAWWIAVAALGAALPIQASVLRHGMAAFLAAACLAVLVLDRRRYHVETARRSRRVALMLWLTAAVAATAAIALAAAVTLRLAGLPVDMRDAGGGALSWAAFGDLRVAFPRWHEPALLIVGTLAARVVVIIGIVAALAPGDGGHEKPGEEAHASEVAARYGQGALLPFQIGPDTRRFTLPGHDGLLAYARTGRAAVVIGDPIGPPGDTRLVLDAFLRECAHNDWRPAVYQASAGALTPLREAGFATYRIGREAVVDLESFSLAGSRRANLRHTVTRAERGGVRVSWYPHGLGPDFPMLAPELTAVVEAWHRTRRLPLRFTVGTYRPFDLVGNPLVVARNAGGSVIAFTTFRPTGVDGGWVLELLRRVPDCVPGAVEACIVAAAEGLRAAGAMTLSLGLAPLSGLDPATGPVIERALAGGVRLLRPMYDVEGLAFFKGKFAPRWEPRYLAVRHPREVPGVLLALVRLHLGNPREMIAARLQLRATPAR